MGKTYRNVVKHPRSICENSPHSRNHNEKEKKQLHNSIKNKNRNKDELEIDFRKSTKSSHKNIIYHDGPALIKKPIIATDYKNGSYRHDLVSSIVDHNIYPSYINWKNYKTTNENELLEIINNELIMSNEEKKDIKLLQKQLKRRGKKGQFKGNKQSKNYESILNNQED